MNYGISILFRAIPLAMAIFASDTERLFMVMEMTGVVLWPVLLCFHSV